MIKLLYRGFLSLVFLLFSAVLYAQNNLVEDPGTCSSVAAPFKYTTKKAWSSNTGEKFDSRHTPMAGDIDGDGKVEVISDYTGSDWGAFKILDGATGIEIGSFDRPLSTRNPWANGLAICRFKKPKDTREKGHILVANESGGIVLYEVNSAPGARPITVSEVWKIGLTVSSMPAIGDLDGDGLVEFVVGQYILDAITGNILSTLAYKAYDGNFSGFPLLADLDGDGHPEVAVGPYVYKFKRTNVPKEKLWKALPGMNMDGVSMAADVNQDGKTDLVFRSNRTTDDATIVVWTPETNTEITRFNVTGRNAVSYAFVGDIDGVDNGGGKKYPEIIINTQNILRAYTFNGSSFSLKWSLAHTDKSGATSLTLFDFDYDGVVELIYRDESTLRIFDGRGTAPTVEYTTICGSGTIVEAPIVADVTGDGSADIIVTGNAAGTTTLNGEIMVFEGRDSPWAYAPPVWNQQFYSPLLVNQDLTIPKTVKAPTLKLTQTCAEKNGNVLQLYNGGPMQAPILSNETYCPIKPSFDMYVVTGSITFTAGQITFNITVGNQGLIKIPAGAPIRFYQDVISAANIIGTATLASDLEPGQTVNITKTCNIVGTHTRFYVRLLDDGVNFPAAGTYRDCNITNNTKSFGTLELIKTVNSQNACVNGSSIFEVLLINNSDQTSLPTTYNNITLIDSLSAGWQLISAGADVGTVNTHNSDPLQKKWTISSLAPGESAKLIIVAKSIAAGDNRNTVWVEKVNGLPIGRESIEAYVVVINQQAPAAAVISPANARLCGTGVTLTANGAIGATAYQWYKNNTEITGATSNTLNVTSIGNYTVNYFNGTCVSQISTTVKVTVCDTAKNDVFKVFECDSVIINVLANDVYTGTVTTNITANTSYGTLTPDIGTLLKYKDAGVCDGGKTDLFKYKICNGSYCSNEAEVKIIILKTPNILLHDKCSHYPKLSPDVMYPGVYSWWYSADGSTGWTAVGTTTDIYPTLEGWYRLTINYDGLIKDTFVKFNIDSIVILSGLKWYNTSIN